MATVLLPIDTNVETSPELQEQQYVHNVYDQIAPHFSSTRYKPWPIISQFLSSLSPGSIGLDSGTGNGKYLPLDQDGSILTIGLDRSLALLSIARGAGGADADGGARAEEVRREVVRADALLHCWRDAAFDYAMSIATIHHLSTPLRRRQAVQALLRAVRFDGGRVLIYVWAVEQDPLSKRVIPEANHASSSATSPTHHTHTSKPSTSGSTAKEQDLLVPWVILPTAATSSTVKKGSRRSRRKNDDPKPATIEVSISTGTGSEEHHEVSLEPRSSDVVSREPPQVFQRYYHFFETDELHDLVCEAATAIGLQVGPSPPTQSMLLTTVTATRGVEIVNRGWERSNLYIELRLWESS
ncbi:tRNA methyltransferase, has a role in tRNA modification [Tulasnella sp. 330]|nr:tRNA methyltransferase, has a role in tRNA modification [Tulasnella sp. 330]KAG8885029.1 tRNA methyltransferase, has a role in tRNA modification [Tulasnella sp. 331]KAG8890896.1 tRNA methyltransferase, has a role in tRNA modification [Tulasnella sp. 332]